MASSQRRCRNSWRALSKPEQPAKTSFRRSRCCRLEFGSAPGKYILKGFVSEIGFARIHAISQPKFRNEIGMFEPILKILEFRTIHSDEIGVHVRRPSLVTGLVISNVSELVEYPRYREIAF